MTTYTPNSALIMTPRRASILTAISAKGSSLTFNQFAAIIPGSDRQLEQHLEYLCNHGLIVATMQPKIRNPRIEITDMGAWVHARIGNGFSSGYIPELPEFTKYGLGQVLWSNLSEYPEFHRGRHKTKEDILDATATQFASLTIDYMMREQRKMPYITESQAEGQPAMYTKVGDIPRKNEYESMLYIVFAKADSYTIDDLRRAIEEKATIHSANMLAQADQHGTIVRHTLPDGTIGYSEWPRVECPGAE